MMLYGPKAGVRWSRDHRMRILMEHTKSRGGSPYGKAPWGLREQPGSTSRSLPCPLGRVRLCGRRRRGALPRLVKVLAILPLTLHASFLLQSRRVLKSHNIIKPRAFPRWWVPVRGAQTGQRPTFVCYR